MTPFACGDYEPKCQRVPSKHLSLAFDNGFPTRAAHTAFCCQNRTVRRAKVPFNLVFGGVKIKPHTHMHTPSQLPRCQMPTKGMHKRLVSRPLIGRSLETGKSTGAEQVLLGRLCVCH